MFQMLTALRQITNWGVDPDMDIAYSRPIIICNRICLTFFVLILLLIIVAIYFFGWILTVFLGIGALPVFLTPILLNRFGFTYGSRVFLITISNLIPLFTSVGDKFHVPGVLEELQYFHLRLVIIAISVFPFILFNLKEKAGWLYGTILNLICLILFDPIHEWFGVGFYQMGFTSPNYYFLNYISVLVLVILTGSSYFLKKGFEASELVNVALINQLNEANQVIEKQSELLSAENQQLNKELVEKNDRLSEMNSELIVQNNDLLQFSYSVSHNLRGPVASLLGLLQLTERETISEEMKILLGHIKRSATSLDTIISDLSSIIEVKNTLSKERQEISLRNEMALVEVMLKKEIDDYGAVIEIDLGGGETIYSVKPMVGSILYNLVSNAIKYRHPVRAPRVIVSTCRENGFLRIDVTDNGLGLDVEKFQEKLFGMYKRFHTHIEGKGLGLFLAKLQAESLGGKIEVQSQLGIGTTFSVFLKTDDTEVAPITS
jgi:signal transduction histidine kinase